MGHGHDIARVVYRFQGPYAASLIVFELTSEPGSKADSERRDASLDLIVEGLLLSAQLDLEIARDQLSAGFLLVFFR